MKPQVSRSRRSPRCEPFAGARRGSHAINRLGSLSLFRGWSQFLSKSMHGRSWRRMEYIRTCLDQRVLESREARIQSSKYAARERHGRIREGAGPAAK